LFYKKRERLRRVSDFEELVGDAGILNRHL
jgi:hypothetical protein